MQVKAFVNQVEQSAKQQLQSKPNWLTSASNGNGKSAADIEIKYAGSNKKEIMADPKAAVMAASRNPNGLGGHGGSLNTTSTESSGSSPEPVRKSKSKKPKPVSVDEPEPPVEIVKRETRPVKPQFYFGQPMTDIVRSQKAEAKQTAIDKVKRNEALTHPRKAEDGQPPATSVTELNHKGKLPNRDLTNVVK